MYKKGFTILELIVVIALIGLIASIILASFSDVRARNRDAKRVSDVKEIEKALSLYQIDNNRFPSSSDPSLPVTITGTDEISVLLESGGHISAVPIDPQHPSSSYTYLSPANGSDFTITFCLETNTIKSFEVGCANTIKP